MLPSYSDYRIANAHASAIVAVDQGNGRLMPPGDPAFHFMTGWTLRAALAYCDRRHWIMEQLPPRLDCAATTAHVKLAS